MPRDANGNMTLVSGNPVVTDTVVSSTTFNNTMADIAAELQDSLSRSGKGGLDTPMKFGDGTAAAPSVTFINETTSGVYRNGAGSVGFSILTALKLLIASALVTIKTALRIEGDVEITGAATIGGAVTASGKITGEGLDASTNTIDNVVDPTTDQQAATKKYVDDAVTAGSTPAAWQAVTAGTNVNVSKLRARKLSNGRVELTGFLNFTGLVNAGDTVMTLPWRVYNVASAAATSTEIFISSYSAVGPTHTSVSWTFSASGSNTIVYITAAPYYADANYTVYFEGISYITDA